MSIFFFFKTAEIMSTNKIKSFTNGITSISYSEIWLKANLWGSIRILYICSNISIIRSQPLSRYSLLTSWFVFINFHSINVVRMDEEIVDCKLRWYFVLGKDWFVRSPDSGVPWLRLIKILSQYVLLGVWGDCFLREPYFTMAISFHVHQHDARWVSYWTRSVQG